ncbi:hypothetical protein ABZY19_28960 [Streptomyces sp. NPDC006475]|uniref:hypothetical protein n=1 Tax=Streptomyces sp. NPDC006475 TaxID=3155719 RepID=UPI0033B3944E
MNKQEAADEQSPGELENLFDAPADGDADPFASWGSSPAAPPAPRPAERPVHAPVPQPTVHEPAPAAAAPYQQPVRARRAVVDNPNARDGQSGFRVSQDVADRLKDYRQAQDLTVTEVVIEALDHMAEDIAAAMNRARMPARVQPKRSRFAARGAQGPLKGTGPVQRWWQPTKGDRDVMAEMCDEAGVPDTPGVLIAVALNEFLPGGAMQIAGELRQQLQDDPNAKTPSDLTISRTYGVSRETARQALVQLQVEGLISTDQS